jgi:hypothetical protein
MKCLKNKQTGRILSTGGVENEANYRKKPYRRA